MSVARSETRRPPARRQPDRLPSRKTREVLGLLLFFVSLILLLALVSYRPEDPSLFYRGAGEPETANWIGRAGAEIAELCYRLMGLPAFALPIALFAAGWRRLRQGTGEKVTGRGFGAGLLVLSLPPLFQLLVREVTWRGVSLHAGGLFGFLVVRSLETRLAFVGTLLVLVSALVIGLALALQSSLDEVLAGGVGRARGVSETALLGLHRRRERREKDRSRRRVVAKHLERAREKKAGKKDLVSARVAAQQTESAPPIRVRRRHGKPEQVTEAEAGHRLESVAVVRPKRRRKTAPPAAEKPPAKKGQAKIAFPKGKRGSALPPINLLDLEKTRPSFDEDELVRLGEVIRERCAEFGVDGSIEGITPGPVITVFEFQPAAGVKVSKVVSLQDDLALSLKAEAIRIDRIPGRSTLGIEVPNPSRSIIRLGPMLADETFKKSRSPLTLALGQTLHGDPYYVDLATMPHLLVAGATGAGKSVGLQAMISSILYKATRDQVQFIFIDPKRIELGVYKNIPHLKAEVVVDPKKASNALRWAVAEMERRYRLLAEVHVRSIDFYNHAIQDPEVQKRLRLKEEEDDEVEVASSDLQPLPYYVIVIDELADLMMVSSADVEHSIARLAQMARAVGIHLIVATQRPSVDVLTGMIKANFPCRLAFATASRHDSRTILDEIGAEKLLGKGDALFMPPGSSRVMRLHGAYVSEQETAGVIRWLRKQGKPELDPSVLEAPVEERSEGKAGGEPDDELYDDAARLVVAEGKASASFLQRRMRIGFSRAARLIDMMELDGLLGPSQGSKSREILVAPDYFAEIDQHE